MKRNPTRAFTLIELLVVVAIIGILAGLLLPALARAKQAGRQIRCLSDFKQWGVAMTLYRDDSENCYPRERAATGLTSTTLAASPASFDVWYNALPPYFSGQTASNYANSLPEFLSSPFFTCPAARFTNVPDYLFFTRAMNAKLIQAGAVTHFADEDMMRLMFVEAGASAEPLLPGQAGPYDGRSYVKWERTSGRHAGRGNGVFGDGHAEFLTPALLISTNNPPF